MRMLASVTGPGEAEAALLGGADIIDLKDPAKGALGAVSPGVLGETIARVAGRRPVSAVAGDLPMEPEVVRAAVAERQAADYVKVGLFPAPAAARRAVIAALGGAGLDTQLIAVFFADGDPDFSLLADLRQAGFVGAMIDTMGKTTGRLLSHLSIDALGRFVEDCRRLGLMSGLAGSLEAPDIPRLAVLKPDYLGFRGALTLGGREDPLDGPSVAAIRALVGADAHAAGVGEAGVPTPEDGDGTDRIFVRDLTVDMEIGAYGFERGRTQKVRFSVEADIARPRVRSGNMAGLYSYDIIMDAVRTLAGRGHTDLVETLAEDLAETLLADRRVRTIGVKVEKLELGPRAVGIEIERRSRYKRP